MRRRDDWQSYGVRKTGTRAGARDPSIEIPTSRKSGEKWGTPFRFCFTTPTLFRDHPAGDAVSGVP